MITKEFPDYNEIIKNNYDDYDLNMQGKDPWIKSSFELLKDVNSAIKQRNKSTEVDRDTNMVNNIKQSISKKREHFTKPSIFEIISEYLRNVALDLRIISGKSLNRIEVVNAINEVEQKNAFKK